MATPRWRRHVAYLPRGDGRGMATPRWQRRGGDGIGSGIGKRRWPRARDRDRKVEVAMGTTLRTCQTSHVAHVPRGALSTSPRGVLAPSSSPTWQVRRWRRERDDDVEVATPSRRRGGVIAPSSSPTGKCGGGDAYVAKGAANPIVKVAIAVALIKVGIEVDIALIKVAIALIKGGIVIKVAIALIKVEINRRSRVDQGRDRERESDQGPDRV
ncbi:hypothetical protein CBR_g52097 [Chara braunii]|uniref:Uncharacterized protein n=1 Tax=Chara braunii TaxID=69332 RepID=A0A388M9M4_CHABU|nr:hypothetical protein CBR_g52097 [Chara braunii]|eukprot:GBG91215.1 hypothetical protein CBR_g52097 [Chara braunii]